MLIALMAGLLFFGSDPFEGTWKLNPAKSKGTIPAEETVVIQNRGKELAVTVSIVNSDAAKSKFAIRYSAPVGGGAGKVEEGPYSGVSLKRVDQRTLETNYLLQDTQVRTTIAVVSQDGKTMTSTGKAVGIGEQGAWIMFFEKR